MIGLLLLCLLVQPTGLIRTQSLIVGLWRAVGQDTDLQRVLFGSNPGRREGSGGLTLMSLWPRPAGPAVPDTPLSHSLVKPATVNSRKHGADGLTQTHRPLVSIIYPPCECFPGNCRFWKTKTANGSSKSASSSDSLFHQPVCSAFLQRCTEGCVIQQERLLQIRTKPIFSFSMCDTCRCSPSPPGRSTIFN